AGERTVDVDLVRRRPRLPRAILRLHGERGLDGEIVDADQHASFGELALQIGLAGVDLAPELVLERDCPVDPGLDPVAPRAGAFYRERSAPLVVAERREERLLPARRAGRLEPDRGTEHVVAVAEDRRRDVDPITGGAL